MAVPTTGNIAILSCPGAVACSSISGIVCGTSTGPQSLKNLATQAGISTASMNNFRGSTIGDLCITPSTITSISSAGGTVCTCAWSACPNTFTVTDACTWICPVTPTAPNPTYPGSTQCIVIGANSGSARSGVVCYTPSHCGTIQCVTVCQNAGAFYTGLYLSTLTSGTDNNCTYSCCGMRLCGLSVGTCADVCIGYSFSKQSGSKFNAGGCTFLNGSYQSGFMLASACVSCSGVFPAVNVKYGCCFDLCACTYLIGVFCCNTDATLYIAGVTGYGALYCVGLPYVAEAYTGNAV